MTLYFLLKILHGLLAAVLLGTLAVGLFFAHRARKGGDLQQIAGTFSSLVRLDLWFIASSAALLPLTGLALAKVGGWPVGQFWLLWSTGLYLVAALCWLPLFWLQVRIRNRARQALREGQQSVPSIPAYLAWRNRLAALLLGVLVAVYALMVIKPL